MLCHSSDVIMGAIVSLITSLTIVHPTVIQTQIKENIEAPRHWPLCWEFTGGRWLPAQMASNAENVSIWWRHHGESSELSGIQYGEVVSSQTDGTLWIEMHHRKHNWWQRENVSVRRLLNPIIKLSPSVYDFVIDGIFVVALCEV